MTVKFCVISIAWPDSAPLTCGRELPLANEGIFKRKIRDLKPEIKEYSEEILKRLQEKYITDPKDRPSAWTKLTIMALCRAKSVQCFDFISKTPFIPHIVHISRVREEEETASLEVYENQIASLRFYLPVKNPKHIFNLSTKLISETLEGLTVDQALVTQALNAVIQDKTMEGIALTIAQGTFIWLKGPSPIAGQENFL